MGLNVVVLMGRMVSDPELKRTQSGVSVSSFRVAVDRSFSKEERKADFIDVVAWKGTAEFICKYFHKGSLIAVNGSLQTRSYEDKNGNRRTAYEVVVEKADFCGDKKTEVKPDFNGFPKGSANDFSTISDDEDMPF